MKPDIEIELKRLLQEGEQLGELDKSPEAWEKQARYLIDQFLGPKLESPPNAHSQGYYDFIFSDSHAAKVAVLRTVLSFPGSKIQNQQISSAKENPKSVERKFFDFQTTKGIIEFVAALVAVVTGLVAFIKWLL